MNETGVANKPQRPSQVSEQSGNVSGAINRLADTISDLGDKLPRVLRDEPENESVSEKDEELVALAHDLRVNANDINVQTNRLRSMIERLEL